MFFNYKYGLFAAMIGICSILQVVYAQSICPYQNPKLSVEVRVNDLLQRMTLEEKIRSDTSLAFLGLP